MSRRNNPEEALRVALQQRDAEIVARLKTRWRDPRYFGNDGKDIFVAVDGIDHAAPLHCVYVAKVPRTKLIPKTCTLRAGGAWTVIVPGWEVLTNDDGELLGLRAPQAVS
jgi:hypothetical protein